MPLAHKTGVVSEGALPVHARRPGVARAVCAPNVQLGDTSNAIFEPEHPASCRLCVYEIESGGAERSYFDWLSGKLTSKVEQRAFQATFDALVNPTKKVQCAEDTAFEAARSFGELERQYRRDMDAEAERLKRERHRRRIAAARGEDGPE